MCKKRDRRELVNKLCFNCVNDCKSQENFTQCINFKKGLSAVEYWKLIKEQNINLRKLCDKNNLKLNIMLDMLNNQIHFTYKYRYVLKLALYEKEEYLMYIDKFSEVI